MAMIALAPFAMIVSSLELVEGHDDHLQLGHGNARWLENRSRGFSIDRAEAKWSWHPNTFGSHYGHMCITVKGPS